MSFALTSFKKDIARWRQDYMAVLIWLAIPLMIGGLITTLMGSDVKPHGTLLLVDEDQTFLSELIVSAYSAGELGEFLSVEKTGFDEGFQRVNDDEASGLLVIPKGFAQAFLESNDTILHAEREDPRVEGRHHEGHHEHDPKEASPGGILHHTPHHCYQQNQEQREEHVVISRYHHGVLLEALWLVAHVVPPSDWSSWATRSTSRQTRSRFPPQSLWMSSSE